MARAHDFINNMPTRYNSSLEENGANLSGGQKQRLAITRALLKKPDILIMDEATSNLDSITEKAIERTINESTQGVTTIIIAHRLSTIMRCDKIYVMDKGEFVESGTHYELMEKGGIYYTLWKEQLPGFEGNQSTPGGQGAGAAMGSSIQAESEVAARAAIVGSIQAEDEVAAARKAGDSLT